MSDKPEIIVCPTPGELAARAAEFIADQIGQAIKERGKANIALAGGSTPEATYKILAQAEIEWDNTQIFFGDERFVPPYAPESNFAMAKRALLDRIAIPNANVFAVNTNLPSAEESAKHYQETLIEAAGQVGPYEAPILDLILLGLGSDGHTASLFPGNPSLEIKDRWVVSSPPGTLPPPVERITFTYPTLNAGRQILFLVTGEGKSKVVQEIVETGAAQYPASQVQPSDGRLTWMLDSQAASLLK